VREKLSDRLAASVAPTLGKIARYFDQDRRSPRGFLLRVTPAGAKVWAVRYRVKDSYREREITIGDVSAWPITDARKRAAELRREIDSGGDPLGDREAKRGAPTVAELARRFCEEALPSRAPRTQHEYKAMLEGWILPAIGRRKVAEVARTDVERLHAKITAEGKFRRANSVKSLVSILFAQAVVWRMREDNPATGIKANRERGRERYLNDGEIARLRGVLTGWREKRPDNSDAVTLLLLTGARRAEVLGMKWSQIEGLDTDKAIWNKPADLTKDRRKHRLPLSQDAVAVLRRRQAERDADKIVRLSGDNVFRGAGTRAHASSLERDWLQIRCAAGLDGVRLHDLRHSFASILVSAGLSLPVIGGLLGHSKAATTQRYAHLFDQPLREATEIAARRLRGAK
jgi:integrase